MEKTWCLFNFYNFIVDVIQIKHIIWGLNKNNKPGMYNKGFKFFWLSWREAPPTLLWKVLSFTKMIADYFKKDRNLPKKMYIIVVC